MPCLLSLSEEILTRIISFLTHPVTPDYPCLCALALTSHTFNRLTIPLLYTNIVFLHGSYNYGNKHLTPFTYQMLRNPHLAAKVRSFSLRDNYGTNNSGLRAMGKFDKEEEGVWGPRRGWPSPSFPKLDEILAAAMSRAGFSDAREIGDKILGLKRGNDESLLLSILLASLPNLRSLDLIDGEGDSGRELSHFFSEHADKMGKLENVFVGSDGDHGGYKYPTLPFFFGACAGLPSVKRLFGSGYGTDVQEGKALDSVRALPKGTSPLEVIELRNSQLQSEDLTCLLAAPRSLHTFLYEVGHGWAWTDLKFTDIKSALSPHFTNLVNLALDPRYYLDEGHNDDFTPISFRDFTALEYLRVGSMFLVGTSEHKERDLRECFPVGLKRLNITHFGEKNVCQPVSRAMCVVMEGREDFLPKLHELGLDVGFKPGAARLDMAGEVSRCARENGVAVKVTSNDYRNDPNHHVRYCKDYYERGWGIDEEYLWGECWGNHVWHHQLLSIDM